MQCSGYPGVRRSQSRFSDFVFFQAEDGIRDLTVTGVQTCALPISNVRAPDRERGSLPKVKLAGTVNALGFQNGVVAVLKFELLFVWLTPGTTFTRAIDRKSVV